MKFLETLLSYLQLKPSSEILRITIHRDATGAISIIDGIENITEHISFDDLDELIVIVGRMRKKLDS